ncbi:tail protein X [Cloacibacillus evryensis]|uniref:tail protein X n=2 Tax=Cloacibacillus evryensis TaxID=508460 RepID=UPI0005529246|nr:tail protein X [Cloacibacillus evryensis]
MRTITTMSGDTWDVIAWRIWGDGADQGHMADLIGANQQHVQTAMFPGNVTLAVPEITEEEPASVPPWRQ